MKPIIQYRTKPPWNENTWGKWKDYETSFIANESTEIEVRIKPPIIVGDEFMDSWEARFTVIGESVVQVNAGKESEVFPIRMTQDQDVMYAYRSAYWLNNQTRV